MKQLIKKYTDKAKAFKTIIDDPKLPAYSIDLAKVARRVVVEIINDLKALEKKLEKESTKQLDNKTSNEKISLDILPDDIIKALGYETLINPIQAIQQDIDKNILSELSLQFLDVRGYDTRTTKEKTNG